MLRTDTIRYRNRIDLVPAIQATCLMATKDTPTFKNPPIDEFVLGIQFDPLPSMQSAHFGLFWKSLGQGWKEPRDNQPIHDTFETFGNSAGTTQQFRLQLEASPPLPRVTFIDENRDRVIQIQRSRFHLNWRRAEEAYPSYKSMIGEFEKKVDGLIKFCDQHGLGPVKINQWEITYVDRFKKGEYWDTPSDWGNFLPGLFQSKELELIADLEMEGRSLNWSFEIRPELGRLHIQTSMVKGPTPEDDSLTVNFTARGPLHPERSPTYRDGMDIGHRVSVHQFLKLVDPDILKSWGEKT
jgi:uncharacterized protein (TIGR04255 family)